MFVIKNKRSNVNCQGSKVKCRQSGYIALMSAIIISILLLAITVNLGFNGFFGRLNIVDSYSKERSSALAEACVDVAILKLVQDLSYIPSPAFDFTNHDFTTQTDGEKIIVANPDSCIIVSVDTSGNQKTIKTQSVVNKAYTNLEVVVGGDNDFEILSWKELANFPAP